MFLCIFLGPPDAEVQDQHLERDVIQQAYESKELRQVFFEYDQ